VSLFKIEAGLDEYQEWTNRLFLTGGKTHIDIDKIDNTW